jgi:hypothetical protein
MTEAAGKSTQSKIGLTIANDIPQNSVMPTADAENKLDEICRAWRLTSSDEREIAKNSIVHYFNKNTASPRGVNNKPFHINGKPCQMRVAMKILGKDARAFHRAYADLAYDLGVANPSDFEKWVNKYNLTEGTGYLVIDVLDHCTKLSHDERDIVTKLKDIKTTAASNFEAVDSSLMQTAIIDKRVNKGNGHAMQHQYENY